jgi:hypothetical protein
MVAKVKAMGDVARPVCEEVISQIGVRDITRDTIRNSAVRLLKEWDEENVTQDNPEDEPDDDQESLLVSFHRVLGIDLLRLHDQSIY